MPERCFNISVDVWIDTNTEADGQETVVGLLRKALREHPEVRDFDLQAMWVVDGGPTGNDPNDDGHEAQ